MFYEAHLYLLDTDETYPARVYLPGAPVPLDGDEKCVYCDNPMAVRGTRGEDFDLVPQNPATGDHDGVVTFTYDRPGFTYDNDPAHFRCVLDSDTGVLTLGAVNADFAPRGRHAEITSGKG